MKLNFAIAIPMANEADGFFAFIDKLKQALDKLESGRVYIVVDKASKDNTLALCKSLANEDDRFEAIWAPENRNVVDAYLRGYKEALKNGHEYIIEMDGGLSHDPAALPIFLKKLAEGKQCVFGSRFISGGSMDHSTYKRKFLSRYGTILSNSLLGTKMYDATSGYQGFHASIVKKFVAHGLLSKAHFYQTELRYLLRKTAYVEIPISYKTPSASVSKQAIYNSLYVLLYYLFLRLTFRPAMIK